MNIKDKFKIKKFYLEKKKELLLNLKKNVTLIDCCSPNGYFLCQHELKDSVVNGYLYSNITEDEIKYLKDLADRDGINFNVKFSPYRPFEFVATTEYVNNNIGSFKRKKVKYFNCYY